MAHQSIVPTLMIAINHVFAACPPTRLTGITKVIVSSFMSRKEKVKRELSDMGKFLALMC